MRETSSYVGLEKNIVKMYNNGGTLMMPSFEGGARQPSTMPSFEVGGAWMMPSFEGGARQRCIVGRGGGRVDDTIVRRGGRVNDAIVG